ncbi:hypothetical protein [Limobrevibacterium gyesilva]|uniref:Uncharacterized protein n=1 Tax=Limobrevibacterium gyesilva TaxID=2991712 RepID=A0AA42CD36_9PROT|nr:hypothetical protein [Limobrevibacterium gyesilva]MCW3473194.1 hypothetical protein [Limobrevibacterium gyesilva]
MNEPALPPPRSGAADGFAVTVGLDDLLLDSLARLAAAGEVEAACRLAGKACQLQRRSNERSAHRFNALLHRLTPQLQW